MRDKGCVTKDRREGARGDSAPAAATAGPAPAETLNGQRFDGSIDKDAFKQFYASRVPYLQHAPRQPVRPRRKRFDSSMHKDAGPRQCYAPEMMGKPGGSEQA